MRHRQGKNIFPWFVLLILGWLSACAAGSPALAPTVDAGSGADPQKLSQKNFARGRVIVRFKERFTEKDINEFLGKSALRAVKKFRTPGMYLLEILDPDKPVKTVVKELETSGWVKYAEPDYIQHPGRGAGNARE